jgi:cell wall-associated NlpC family hydrolase
MIETFIRLGKWSEEELDRIINESSQIADTGKRIDFLSRHFLSLPYAEFTLIGDMNTPEVFVINLEGFDCLTFIEYIEAMLLSSSLKDFEKSLKKVRYKSGDVAFASRNHFFTDWVEFNANLIDDVTEKTGSGKTIRILKLLNEKADKTFFVPGINPAMREIRYIPSEHVDESVLKRLEKGDYIGIYSHLEGLDVSHVGIFIKNGKRTLLRHASSAAKNRSVIDEDFMKYISDKPGIVVLRAKSVY